MRCRRVLLLSSNPTIHLARWAKALAASYPVEVLDVSDGRHAAAFPAGIPVRRLELSPARPLRSVANLARVAAACARAGTVVNIHYVNRFLACIAAFLPGRYVLSFWGSDALVDYAGSRGFFLLAYRIALRRALVATANSEIVSRRLSPSATRLRRIDWPVESSTFRRFTGQERAAARDKLGLGPDTVTLYSNRLGVPNYRVLEIIETFAANFPRDGSYALLVHFPPGSDPDYVARSKEAARGTRCAISAGDMPIAERLTRYAAADFLLSFPVSDSYPSSLIEAAACGILPACAADTPSYDDIEKDFRMLRMACGDLSPSALAIDRAAADAMRDENAAIVERRFREASFEAALARLYDTRNSRTGSGT